MAYSLNFCCMYGAGDITPANIFVKFPLYLHPLYLPPLRAAAAEWLRCVPRGPGFEPYSGITILIPHMTPVLVGSGSGLKRD